LYSKSIWLLSNRQKENYNATNSLESRESIIPTAPSSLNVDGLAAKKFSAKVEEAVSETNVVTKLPRKVLQKIQNEQVRWQSNRTEHKGRDLFEVTVATWCVTCTNARDILECADKVQCSPDSICFTEQRSQAGFIK
jgi:hypothetical protein